MDDDDRPPNDQREYYADSYPRENRALRDRIAELERERDELRAKLAEAKQKILAQRQANRTAHESQERKNIANYSLRQQRHYLATRMKASERERDAAIARADGVPDIPPLDRIRALAREVGYAIGVHGSQARDLDLIAAPWVDEAVDANTLVAHLAAGLGAVVIGPHATKPLGRVAFTLQIDGWFKPIDLSVCPSLRDAIARAEKAEGYLLSLLARVHRDGGHATDRLGTEKSVAAAHDKVANAYNDLARERALADRLAAACTRGSALGERCHYCGALMDAPRRDHRRDCPVAEHAAARKGTP